MNNQTLGKIVIRTLSGALTALALTVSGAAWAAGDAAHPAAMNWSHAGPLGTFDRGALHRGLQVYREVCAACHSLDLVPFRTLQDVGFSEDDIKALAAEYEVEDGPDNEGEMYTRPGLPSDTFVAPFPNEKAARASNNGTYPPDLSLIIKARQGGEDYLYALLTGYQDEAPEGVDLADGMSFNPYFIGHQIAMPSPLFEDLVEYEDGTAASVEQMASDVSVFLAWAAEPMLEARHRMGVKVLIFLSIMLILLIFVKRRVWSDVH